MIDGVIAVCPLHACDSVNYCSMQVSFLVGKILQSNSHKILLCSLHFLPTYPIGCFHSYHLSVPTRCAV